MALEFAGELDGGVRCGAALARWHLGNPAAKPVMAAARTAGFEFARCSVRGMPSRNL